MKLIQCPNTYSEKEYHTHMVFLAGGITGAPDWQSAIAKMLSPCSDRLTLLNPRRDGFDIHDPGISDYQIEWEFKHLKAADTISFWFPKEAPCMITLFELGASLHRTNILVGIEPGYAREYDVRKQLSLYRPRVEHEQYGTIRSGVKIVDSLELLAEQIKELDR